MLSGAIYSSTFAASSPTVSRSSSQPSPSVRVPRYLRRYTICAATQHRPTSPLANSFTPDYSQEADAGFSESPQWARRRSEAFTVNPGPKVHHYSYTTIPSPSPSSLFAPVLSPTALSRAQSLVADQRPLRRQSSNSSLHSQSSLSPSLTECSFHTAFDQTEYNRDQANNNLRPLSPNDTPIDSWVDHPLSIKNDWSDSSNSGFRSSGIASRGGQSSDDTVVSPTDGPKGEKKKDDDNDDDDEEEEWPVMFPTTITRRDLERYDKENEKKHKRTFTWGRKEGQKFTDKDSEEVLVRKKSRRLKKKRPESLQIEEEEEKATPVPAQPFEARILSIYTQGEHEEFDPLKDLPTTHEEPIPDTVLDETTHETQIGIAFSSDDISQSEVHPTLVGQDDEWEDMESSDAHHGYRYRQERMPSEDDRDIWLDDSILERVRSRTPQEILRGLDVVHEEEEEDSIKTEDAPGGDLEKRVSYPYIKNKGKERQVHDDIHEETIEEVDTLHDGTHQSTEADVPDSSKKEAPYEDTPQRPASDDPPPSSPRRRKLSKRRPSRRKLDTDSPPPLPLPERNPKLKTKSSSSKTNLRHRTSKNPSVPTLRPRRTTGGSTTPKTVMSSVRSHVFRPFTSFALLLGINVGNSNGRKRLSRELRTPNALLLGRHFSEKHIPRFPSRLDGKRTVDKKIVKYE